MSLKVSRIGVCLWLNKEIHSQYLRLTHLCHSLLQSHCDFVLFGRTSVLAFRGNWEPSSLQKQEINKKSSACLHPSVQCVSPPPPTIWFKACAWYGYYDFLTTTGCTLNCCYNNTYPILVMNTLFWQVGILNRDLIWSSGNTNMFGGSGTILELSMILWRHTELSYVFYIHDN